MAKHHKLIQSCGLFWDRDKVNWSRRPARLLGRLKAKDRAVDFRDQAGSRRPRVPIVGPTLTPESRLLGVIATFKRLAGLVLLLACLPVGAQNPNDFTVTSAGIGNDDRGAPEKKPLPYPLEAGEYEVTTRIAGGTSFLTLSSRNSGNVRCQGLGRMTLSPRDRLRRIKVGYEFSAVGLDICPGGADLRASLLDASDDEWSVRFRRLGNPVPTPDPNPEPPSPPSNGPCTPTTDVLHFDGGYRVRMCYTNASGSARGQAKAGVWASGESGLLWFFERENAEALVKVLNGCPINGHRWVFVAPVTDLGLSLRITGPTGRTWNYTNSAGETAPTRADTRAFPCSDESSVGSPPTDGDPGDPPSSTDPPSPALPTDPIDACYHRQLSVGLSGGARMSDRRTIQDLNFAIDSSFTPDTYSKIENMIPRIIRELAGVQHRGRIKSGSVVEEEVSWGTWRTIEYSPRWISVVRHPTRGRAATQRKEGLQRDYRLLRTDRFHDQPYTVLISDDGWNSADVVIAHELGHAIFGLGHVSDADNIMCTDHYVENGRCSERSKQWSDDRDKVSFVSNLKSYVKSQLDIADACAKQ